jgi:hypothetical protein
VTAPASGVADAFLTGILEDETRLGQLLGWGNIVPPATLAPNFWLFGTSGGERGGDARLASGLMPRWRRAWSGAGELVVRCNLQIAHDADRVIVQAGGGDLPRYTASARKADFPNADEALFFAMCKAALLYLEDERAQHAAARQGTR